MGPVRISAELPWPAIFFMVGANIVTLAAWYKFRHTSDSRVEDSVTETVEEEKVSTLEDESKEREMGIRV
jgi:hypothetical protein